MNMDPTSGVKPIEASAIPIERLSGNSSLTQEQKVHEVARQFEAVLIRQILQSANRTGISGAAEEGGAGKDIYFDMLNFQLAESISKGGGLGLASAFEAQLQRQLPTSLDEPEQP